jgi:prepilin-type N-terminal cleavage/methylation domain-containing protein
MASSISIGMVSARLEPTSTHYGAKNNIPQKIFIIPSCSVEKAFLRAHVQRYYLCMRKTNAHKSRGFTLIELLVVIAIIGLLSSVVLASMGSKCAAGRDARRLADMQSFLKGLELYYLNNGYLYPGAVGTFYYSGPSSAGCATACTGTPVDISTIANFIPNVMPVAPKDPDTAKCYCYTPLSSNQGFRVWMAPEDTSAGGPLSKDNDCQAPTTTYYCLTK